MWADPIDNALSTALFWFNRLRSGEVVALDAAEIQRARNSLDKAREVREFEKAQGRLVTPEDPF